MRKNRLVILFCFCLAGLFSLTGCDLFEDSEVEPSSNNSGGGGGNGNDPAGPSLPGYGGTAVTGYWERNDGMRQAYLDLRGTTAKTCVNNVVTTGTFKNSKPYSMTFTIQGDVITFPLDFSSNGSKLIVGVPEQAWNTNTATDYIKSSTFPCNSSGGGGGGTGGGNGEAMFWTRTDHGCGSISVTVSNQTKSVTSFYSSGSPSCGASGCATFSLPEGTYSFTAQCGSYKWGPSSITVTEGGCYKMELN